jgi:hypothetical protein
MVFEIPVVKSPEGGGGSFIPTCPCHTILLAVNTPQLSQWSSVILMSHSHHGDYGFIFIFLLAGQAQQGIAHS